MGSGSITGSQTGSSLGSAGSHPAVIVFKLCCCTNKHMGACRTVIRTPTRLQACYTLSLSGAQVSLSVHHSSLLRKKLHSWLNVDLDGLNYDERYNFVSLLHCSFSDTLKTSFCKGYVLIHIRNIIIFCMFNNLICYILAILFLYFLCGF